LLSVIIKENVTEVTPMMASLWQSRKFRITIVDIVFSTAAYFITKYVAPEIGNDIFYVIGLWQPVIISLITGIAIEDAAMKRTL